MRWDDDMVETPQPIRLIASRAAAWNHHTGDAMAADGVGSLYQIVREHPDFFVVAPPDVEPHDPFAQPFEMFAERLPDKPFGAKNEIGDGG